MVPRKSTGKLYSLNFAAYVELEGKLDPDDLQAALCEVQEATPLLRSRIVVESNQPVFAPVDPQKYHLQLEILALAPPSSMLTNIGRIDEIDLGQELAVRDAGFLLSPPAQYPICITASSYRGAMLLNLLYDRSKISQTQAKRIAGNLLGHLEAAAQI